jgi:hypothetical protein
MRQFLKDLFSDSSNVSMMRVLCFIALMLAGYLALSGHDTSVPAFVTAAFGGKVAQKFAEIKKDL